jgi:hypothetical protein
MKNIPIIFFILIAFSFWDSCKKDEETPIQPPTQDTVKGKRDYVWSIDSVDYGTSPSLIQLESIWGSSATNLWGVAGGAPDVRDCLWHYDGKKWSRATAGTPITENTGNKAVYAIWGSASNDIWTFGRKINFGVLSAFIMHYDGARWSDATPSNVASLSSVLYAVYGRNRNDIWAGGDEYLLHYNGNSWSEYKIADSLGISTIAGSDSAIYMDLASHWYNDTLYLYMMKNGQSEKVDYTVLGKLKFGGALWVLNHSLYSLSTGIIATGISSNGNVDINGWKKIFSTETNFTQRYIQSSNNIFAVGQWNLAYHWNGVDWKQMFITVPNHTVDPYALFWGVWTDGKEVFICDTQNGIMYHGK